MRILVTGANGFIGKNLIAHLGERSDTDVVRFTRDQPVEKLDTLVKDVDFVFHLAGINRPKHSSEFFEGNRDLTARLCKAISRSGRKIPVVYTSSIQAELDNPYGLSKREAEDVLLKLHRDERIPIYIFRLPNVFGKWARPNYNSVVATFCYNIARGLPIQVDNRDSDIRLVYIDDVVERFLGIIDGAAAEAPFSAVSPVYRMTVGQLADQIYRFRDSRDNLISERVGTGLTRALYSTYLSYLPKEKFTYEVPGYADSRGVFVEMLKTPDAGQFSFFTAHPGITRGGHYHHSKAEKFLVIKGKARFRFRHILTGEYHELITTGDTPQIVETVPGWTHDITNIGDEEMVVMLWANEIFDRNKPDTYACPLAEQR